MYYWISWVIHAALILTIAAFLVILLRYHRLKPQIRKISSEPENTETREITADAPEEEAIDLNTLYKPRDEL